MKGLIVTAALLAAIPAAASPFSKGRDPFRDSPPPFRLAGNIYYVGLSDVAVYLIKTPAGDILTDGAFAQSVPAIEANIEKLGVKLSDIKILLNSHAHFDHAGGLAKLRADTGARLYASAGDRPILESGHIAFGPAAHIDFPPVTVDHVVRDGETVSLGGITLTAHLTPGHTPGCTSWTMPVRVDGAMHRAIFLCSLSVAGNPLVDNSAWPGIADAYRASFAKLQAMDADIFLAPHAGQFGLDEKRARLKPGAPNPFIDPGEFHRRVAAFEADFKKELARQQANPPKPPKNTPPG